MLSITPNTTKSSATGISLFLKITPTQSQAPIQTHTHTKKPSFSRSLPDFPHAPLTKPHKSSHSHVALSSHEDNNTDRLTTASFFLLPLFRFACVRVIQLVILSRSLARSLSQTSRVAYCQGLKLSAYHTPAAGCCKLGLAYYGAFPSVSAWTSFVEFGSIFFDFARASSLQLFPLTLSVCVFVCARVIVSCSVSKFVGDFSRRSESRRKEDLS